MTEHSKPKAIDTTAADVRAVFDDWIGRVTIPQSKNEYLIRPATGCDGFAVDIRFPDQTILTVPHTFATYQDARGAIEGLQQDDEDDEAASEGPLDPAWDKDQPWDEVDYLDDGNITEDEDA